MFYIKGIHKYLDKKNIDIAFISVIIGVVISMFYHYAVIISRVACLFIG